jgi:hypothetical protein
MTCGVAEHHTDCLCDVHLTQVAPIACAAKDVWHVDMIMRSQPEPDHWTGERFAELYSAVVAAYDASRRVAELGEHVGDRLISLKGKVIRHLQAGHSLTDVEASLGEPLARCVMALTNGTASRIWLWGEREWAEFETLLYSKSPMSARWLQRAAGLSSQHAAENLIRCYGVEGTGDRTEAYNPDELDKTFRVEMRNQAIAAAIDAHPEASITELTRILKEQGHVMHRQYIYMFLREQADSSALQTG